MKKRIFALLTACFLLAGMSATASASFIDISDSETSIAAAALESMGIVTGTGTSTYSPGKTLTRAEFATLAVRAMGLEDKVSSYTTKTLFTDVAPGKWFTGYVNLAYSEGIVSGYGNGKFGPNDNVTYGQVATMMLRMLGYTEAEIGKLWPNDYVTFANGLGLPGSLSLTANSYVNRGQAAVLLYNTVKEPVNGGNKSYYETISGVVNIENAIVLNNNATSGNNTGYLMVCSVGETDASIKYYQQKVTVSDALVGSIGKLLLNSSGRVVGFLPSDGGFKNVTVASANSSGITTRSGDSIRITGSASVISNGSVYKYNATGYLQVDAQSGKSVRLYYDDNGGVSHIYISAGASVSDTFAVYAETKTTASELSRVLGITGTDYSIVKNGAPADKSDLAQYDVAYYDAASNTMYVSDYKITGFITSASPSVGAAETITIGGTSLDVLECAWDTLGSFKLGDTVTLLLTDDNKVAAALKQSTVMAPMIGVLSPDSSSVTLCGSGITVTGKISASSSQAGMLIKATVQNGTITCSSLNPMTTSSNVDVKSMSIGNITLAPGAQIYENAVENSPVYSLDGVKGSASHDMSEIFWTDTLNPSSVAYYHLNTLGQIDVLLLRDVTGNCYDYGKIIKYSGTSGINLGSGGMEAYNDAVTITNSTYLTGSTKYIFPQITIDSGYYGIITGFDSGGYSAIKRAIPLSAGEATTASFHQTGDNWFVNIGSYEIPVSSNVEVQIKSTSNWVKGEAGLLIALSSEMKLSAYYDKALTTGAQVRLIVVG